MVDESQRRISPVERRFLSSVVAVQLYRALERESVICRLRNSPTSEAVSGLNSEDSRFLAGVGAGAQGRALARRAVGDGGE